MSNKMNVAKKCLQAFDFETAKLILKDNGQDPETLYLLALLYRYHDEYEQELAVISQALAAINENNEYLHKRFTWHRVLPPFDHFVPRQPLRLPRDPETIPSQAVLEQMCFVTGADSEYFNMMVECIESIKATELYKDIPICVLDFGLFNDEKEYLSKKFGITQIQDPRNNDDLKKFAHVNIRISVRTMLHKIFPGYQYYFYMNPTVWVQDERAIDRYLSLSQRYGIGAAYDSGDALTVSENMTFVQSVACNCRNIPEKYWNLGAFQEIPFMHQGIVCFNEQYQVFDKFYKYFQLSQGDTVAFHLLCCELKVRRAVSVYDNYQVLRHANQITWVESNNILRANNMSRDIIGFIHLKNSDPLSAGHTEMTALDVSTCQQKQTSYRYRVPPWQDKSEIRELLLLAAQT